MSATIPIFPLNTVVMPGQVVPLRVFEDRYLQMVEYLLDEDDPAQRLFGTVAIRDGHEVGSPVQSWFRIGCLLQLTEAEAADDGSFEIEAVGRSRIRLDRLHQDGDYPEGEVELLLDPLPERAEELVLRATSTFDTYRQVLSDVSGEELLMGALPQDPTMLSWSISAASMLTMPERQSLLEESDVKLRLALATELLEEEIRTMSALPSLPALGIGRNSWSPN